MPFSFRSFGFVGYWGAWFLLYSMKWLLYRGFRQYETWEIREAYPQYKRALALQPWSEILVLALLAGALLLVWTRGETAEGLAIHVLGLFYGLMLVTDALFSRITGIRAVPIFRKTRYVIESERTWRDRLQLALAGIYVAVPTVFLLARLA